MATCSVCGTRRSVWKSCLSEAGRSGISVRRGREKSPRFSGMNPPLGGLFWLSHLSSVHVRNRTKWRSDPRRDWAQLDRQPPLRASPVPPIFAHLPRDWTQTGGAIKTKSSVRTCAGWCFDWVDSGKLHVELDAVALPGELSRVFGGAAPPPLVAAVWMMEPRQALLPLLLLFTLGTSTFGKFKLDLCVDVAHKKRS